MFPNFSPIIIYRIFGQIARARPQNFVRFSAKIFAIYLTMYWKFWGESVIMDFAREKILILRVCAAHREETVILLEVTYEQEVFVFVQRGP